MNLIPFVENTKIIEQSKLPMLRQIHFEGLQSLSLNMFSNAAQLGTYHSWA
jgi:hypothetical protein